MLSEVRATECLRPAPTCTRPSHAVAHVPASVMLGLWASRDMPRPSLGMIALRLKPSLTHLHHPLLGKQAAHGCWDTRIVCGTQPQLAPAALAPGKHATSGCQGEGVVPAAGHLQPWSTQHRCVTD